MKKIIVVGHPQSGYEGVEELLLACGMAEAQPSRREGFTPVQISETLAKVHGAVPVQYVRVAEQLEQINVAPVWQGLALDLMLANMELPLWGWADTQAVYLLDYWKSQDPQTVFVLVFDEPLSVLTRQTLEQADAGPEELEAKVNAWMAYNSAVLHFHLCNPDRSLLVHAAQVQTSAKSYLQQVSSRINTQLQLPGEAELQEASENPQSVLLNGQSRQGLESNVLAQWLARQLLEEYPQATELYEQLQATASLPQHAHGEAGRQLLATDVQASRRYQAWYSFVAQQMLMQEHAQRLEQQDKTLNEQEQQIEALRQTDTAAQLLLAQQQQLLANNASTLQASAQENHMLLEQLHKVQEELENRYLQSKLQGKALVELPRVQADLKAAQEKVSKLAQTEALVGELKAELQISQGRIQQLQQGVTHLKAAQEKVIKLEQTEALVGELKAELQTAHSRIQQWQQSGTYLKKNLQLDRAETSVTDLQSENELLLTQLHKVQEELERYYLENRQLKASEKPQSKAYYGAADRVRQQLSYRLGATMIAQSRSVGGWFGMPFALQAEAKRFKQEQAARSNQKLPPITQYRDAHEAERIKQHLSYRLGARMIANSRSLGGWVSMPWFLLVEVKAFRQARR
ncbi:MULTISPECIES: hypothetical protein [Comamonas]|uniref:hypothetical protein n=1 Tax=Comamonas TaxID=283 RepID=UPI0001DA707D|nr:MULTISPECIES: hypothetical protein [Comamonas]EFI60590.1 chromosome segregation ATPases-like protein [Comamonas thiooxydans]TFF59055.1 chromosome partitioning protein ParA [Comamonas sp. A23]